MVSVVVEHKWKEKNKDEVFKVVGGIVEMAKNGKLPEGFQLKEINVFAGEPKAICNWEAPGVREMSELLSKVNPPTKNSVFEVQKIF